MTRLEILARQIRRLTRLADHPDATEHFRDQVAEVVNLAGQVYARATQRAAPPDE